MRLGVTITKSTMFRNADQEFHNTYYFTLNSALTAPSESIVDEVVATERALHATTVNFRRAKVWTAGGTKAENQMIFQKPLAGTGDQTSSSAMDRERAVMVSWKAGFDSRGKQVYLRKWYHCCGNAAGQSLIDNGILANTQVITDPVRTAIQNKANENRIVGGTETWDLTAKSGRGTTDAAVAYKYLEHHQLGDMWR